MNEQDDLLLNDFMDCGTVPLPPSPHMNSPAFMRARLQRKSMRLMERQSISEASMNKDFLLSPPKSPCFQPKSSGMSLYSTPPRRISSKFSLGRRSSVSFARHNDNIDVLSQTVLLPTDSPSLEALPSPDVKRQLFTGITPAKRSLGRDVLMMASPCTNLSEDLMLFLQVKDEELHENDESPNVAPSKSRRSSVSKFCAPSDAQQQEIDEEEEEEDESYRHVLFPITPIIKNKRKNVDTSGYDSDDVVLKSPMRTIRTPLSSMVNAIPQTETMNTTSTSTFSTLDLMRQKKKAAQLLKQQQSVQAVNVEVQKILDKARQTTENKKKVVDERKRKREEEVSAMRDNKKPRVGLLPATKLTTTTTSRITSSGYGRSSSTASITSQLSVPSPAKNTPSKIPRFNPSNNVNRSVVNATSRVTASTNSAIRKTPSKTTTRNGVSTTPRKVASSSPRPFNLSDAEDIHSMNLPTAPTSIASRFGFRSNLMTNTSSISALTAQNRIQARAGLKSIAQVPSGLHSSKVLNAAKTRRDSRLFAHQH